MVGIFFVTFNWWYCFMFLVLTGPESCPGVRDVSVSERHSATSSPSSRERNRRGQLRMSECPSTQETAKRHTHSCLLALVWVTLLPPSELHGRECLCQGGNDTELQVAGYMASGIKLLRGPNLQEQYCTLLDSDVATINCYTLLIFSFFFYHFDGRSRKHKSSNYYY